MRIGRLLYLPTAPTGRDGACWESLPCFGLKPTFVAAASTLEDWDWESNGSSSYLQRSMSYWEPDFSFLLKLTSFFFISFPQLYGELLVLKQEKLSKDSVQSWVWTNSLRIPQRLWASALLPKMHIGSKWVTSLNILKCGWGGRK